MGIQLGWYGERVELNGPRDPNTTMHRREGGVGREHRCRGVCLLLLLSVLKWWGWERGAREEYGMSQGAHFLVYGYRQKIRDTWGIQQPDSYYLCMASPAMVWLTWLSHPPRTLLCIQTFFSMQLSVNKVSSHSGHRGSCWSKQSTR